MVEAEISEDDSIVELGASELELDPSSSALTASCTPPSAEKISGGGLK